MNIRFMMKNLIKVKCRLCGKIGLRNQPKALKRHLRFSHNIFISKVDEYFEITDSDCVVQLLTSRKEFRKSMRGIGGRKPGGDNLVRSSFTKIIYTPMGNKR